MVWIVIILLKLYIGFIYNAIVQIVYGICDLFIGLCKETKNNVIELSAYKCFHTYDYSTLVCHIDILNVIWNQWKKQGVYHVFLITDCLLTHQTSRFLGKTDDFDTQYVGVYFIHLFTYYAIFHTIVLISDFTLFVSHVVCSSPYKCETIFNINWFITVSYSSIFVIMRNE